LSDVPGGVFCCCGKDSGKCDHGHGFVRVKTFSNYSHQPNFLNAIALSYDAEFNGEYFAYLIQTNF
jgi:hypothetical protein